MKTSDALALFSRKGPLMRYAALLLVTSSLSAQAPHPFGFADWAASRSAAPVAVAPDGRTILYRVVWGGTSGPTNHEWRLMDRTGSGSRVLDLSKGFSPDGFGADAATLYGTFEVKDLPQLAMAPVAGGEPRVLTTLPRGVSSAALSPDGARFAVLADPRAPDSLEAIRTVVANPETGLYVLNADGSDGAWWCAALRDIDQVAWAPDGRSVAVLSSTRKIGHHDVTSALDVCTADRVQHLADIPTAASGLAWSDHGRTLVFLSTTTSVLTPDHVWTIPAAGGTPADVTPDLVGSASGLRGDARGSVWVLVTHGVRLEIDSLGLAAGRPALVPAFSWSGGIVGSPVTPELARAPATLVAGVSDPTHAGNVAVADGGRLRKLTTEGDDVLAHVAFGLVRVVDWTAKDGVPLEGIVTFPAGYQAGSRYPYLVLPHGGPEGNDVLALDPLARIIAGMGYVVMQPEYRGSTGYGSAFLDAIYQHFGDRAYDDVQSATDYAVAQGWADSTRLAIFGWSAGGFMTSWTVTQTHRYRAAIEGAGITDWLSFIPTSDIAQVDYDARWPEEDAGPFLKFSAVMFADRVTTPLLILHGGADERVPTFQGREFFMLLAERGKTVKMVVYPGSPHFPAKWEQRRDVFDQIASWLLRYNP